MLRLKIFFISLFFICLSFHICAAEPLIKAKVIQNHGIRFVLSDEFSKKYVNRQLCISYPDEIDLASLPSSILEVPLITNAIAAIWLSGNVYSIEEMDEDLYYSLIKIKEFFKRFFYNTSWEGELRPGRLIKNIPPKMNSRPAALFTAGLDSTTTLFRHFDENPILISFNAPHCTAVDFAQMHGFDFYQISINYGDFLKLTMLDKASCDITKWFWDTSMGLAWVGAATPMLYAMGVSLLYIPSGFTWRSFIMPDGQTLRQPASPLIDENLSPMGLQVIHDPFTMTRTEKMKFISSFCSDRNFSKPQFIVCNTHGRANTTYGHCNRCMKCLITMLDILAIGENLQDYDFTFREEEFIPAIQSFVLALKSKRGGTYSACRDTQNYVRQNIEDLPSTYRSFFEWFISIDLWEMIDEPLQRPARATPFCWMDYRDLYPGVEEFVEQKDEG